jgi:hypothetical protein
MSKVDLKSELESANNYKKPSKSRAEALKKISKGLSKAEKDRLAKMMNMNS